MAPTNSSAAQARKDRDPTTHSPRASGDSLRLVTPSDEVATRNRAVWTAGDFHHIALGIARGGEEFVERLELRPGERVLDVACGTGNLSIPAARAGATVTGLDIAPNLLATARERASHAGVTVAFEEGNAEALPYPSASFDTVISMFGVMFAARAEQAAAELVRVTRPGGRIVLANWTPDGFIGDMLRLHTARRPAPAGLPSPLLWGQESTMRSRFQRGVAQLDFARRPIALTYPGPAEFTVDLFEKWYGPTVTVFGAISPAERDDLRRELTSLWATHNLAGPDHTRVVADYLEVTARVS